MAHTRIRSGDRARPTAAGAANTVATAAATAAARAALVRRRRPPTPHGWCPTTVAAAGVCARRGRAAGGRATFAAERLRVADQFRILLHDVQIEDDQHFLAAVLVDHVFLQLHDRVHDESLLGDQLGEGWERGQVGRWVRGYGWDTPLTLPRWVDNIPIIYWFPSDSVNQKRSLWGHGTGFNEVTCSCRTRFVIFLFRGKSEMCGCDRGATGNLQPAYEVGRARGQQIIEETLCQHGARGFFVSPLKEARSAEAGRRLREMKK